MTDGLLQIRRSGRTSHPLLASIFLAQAINRASGGAVIAPWEVGELLEQAPEWADAAQVIVNQLPQQQKADAQVEAWKENWRNNHPGYRFKH